MQSDLNSDFSSWGRFPKAQHADSHVVWTSDEFPPVREPALPVGQGRSYGDSCVNNGGYLLRTDRLDRFLAFDSERGVIRVEAGVTLSSILDFTLPKGWFLPVVPGTRFVSVGGAIANDIHGKNHHRVGTFGCFVERFELLRSTGERKICSPSENGDWFAATVGGLGLTGLITWAELRLRRVRGPFVSMDRIQYPGLNAFFDLAAASDRQYEYTVAWVDCLAQGPKLGRGVFMQGNHSETPAESKRVPKGRQQNLLFDAPSFLLNSFSVRLFNELYYRRGWTAYGLEQHYQPFFFPLDSIQNWNRLYGRRGFLQYQCVVPFSGKHSPIRDILSKIAKSGSASFLAVLKLFGDHRSPGILSFPQPGVTLALDFGLGSPALFDLLKELDVIVVSSGGRVYPAKDSRMSSAAFQAFFPRWEELANYRDPMLRSDFWKRVTECETL